MNNRICDNNGDFVIENGMLKKYEGWDREVAIPEGVTVIGADAFQSSYNLEAVTLPESVKKIGKRAFYSCPKLKQVILPEGLKEIGKFAFAHCHHLETIHFPSTLETIDEGAFWECMELEQVELPAACLDSTVADKYIFHGCKRLASVVLVNKTEDTRPAKNSSTSKNNIAAESNATAQNGTVNESSVMTENSITTEISMKNAPKPLISVDNILYTEDMHELVFCPPGWKKHTIQIPDEVRIIGTYAFKDCRKLIRIQLPESLEQISYGAFSGCSHLKTMDIPAGCKKIFPCFAGCKQLTKIYVAEGNENYFSHNDVLMGRVDFCSHGFHEKEAFEQLGNDCILYAYPASKRGTEYIIPDFVTVIGEQAFHSNRTLKSILIPETIHTILDQAFVKCSLLKEITIPAAVKELPFCGFSGCKRLEAAAILSQSTQLPMYFFEKCYKLTSVTLSNAIKQIGHRAFAECSALTGIHLPTALEEIDTGAFDSCISLRTLRIPSGITEIKSFTFERCSELTEIIIPDSVKKICKYAFSNLESLHTVVVLSKDIVIDQKAFPAGMYAFDDNNGSYNTEWDNDDSFEPYDEKNQEYEELHFYGIKNSDTEEYARKYGLNFHVIPFMDALNTCELEDTKPGSSKGYLHIEKTKYYDFSDFEEKEAEMLIRYFGNEETVEIPGNAKIIAANAFANRSKVRKIIVSEGVEKIQYSAFADCYGLEEIVLPQSLREISFGSFAKCTNLKEIILPNVPLQIQPNAFAGCSSLKRVIVPENVMLIPNELVWCEDENCPWEQYDIFENCPHVVIYGVSGSNAEEYAKMARIPFNPYLNKNSTNE